MPRFSLLFTLVAVLALGCEADSTQDASGRQSASTRGVATAEPSTATATIPSPTEAPLVTRDCAPPYPEPPFTAVTVFCADPSLMERAAVVRIVDGDTLRVLRDGREEVVRIFGVDTPERGERCFDEASERLEQLAGGEVHMLPDARERDRFDRLLRYVYTTDGLSIDAVLIAEGLGYAWTRDGALRDPLVALERQASSAGAGCLWSRSQ